MTDKHRKRPRDNNHQGKLTVDLATGGAQEAPQRPSNTIDRQVANADFDPNDTLIVRGQCSPWAMNRSVARRARPLTFSPGICHSR